MACAGGAVPAYHQTALLRESMYATHLARWSQFVARKSLLVLQFDALLHDPQKGLRAITSFYGLPLNEGTITLHRDAHAVPEAVTGGELSVVPFHAGETIAWRSGERTKQ